MLLGNFFEDVGKVLQSKDAQMHVYVNFSLAHGESLGTMLSSTCLTQTCTTLVVMAVELS